MYPKKTIKVDINQKIKNFEKFRKEFESLQERSIPNFLKELSKTIKNDILSNKNFDKHYKEIEPIDIHIKLNYNSNKYYSNIDLHKILFSQSSNIDFEVNIPNKYDSDYVVAIIIHEIRHIYDIFTVNSDYDMKSFVDSYFIGNLRKGKYGKFINLIYYSLEHELIARNNMIFPYIGLKNISKDETIKIVKESFIYTSLVELSKFNHINFINSINLSELIELTNLFIRDVDKNNQEISNLNEVTYFYKKWENYFKNISVEWEIEMYKEINKIYEYKTSEYNEDTLGGAQRLFEEIYKKVIV